MLRIDVKRKDVGKITGEHWPSDFDRPAHYQLGDKFFDCNGWEIVPGEPFDAEAAGEDEGGDGGAPLRGFTPATLMAEANTMPWPEFKAHAQDLLGAGCAKSKGAIVEQLKALVDGRKLKTVTVKREVVAVNDASAPKAGAVQPVGKAAREAKGGPKAWPAKIAEQPAAAASGAPGPAAAGATPAPAKPSAPAAKPAAAAGKPGAIDLAAWARGEVNYLNGQLTKAAREQHGAQFTERGDILDMLIEKGVVAADEARGDL